jgi:uncharacterized protein involved in exopolysaccharide biosynthesis/Mrp family chromosome partitioning ATPase
MPDLRHEAPPASIGANDILFALFRHKGKVLLCAIAGFVAAAAVYFFYPAVYESQAKLLVRYVLDRSPVDDGGTASTSTSGFGKTTENVMNSEVEILTSHDLAAQVADAIRTKGLLPQATNASINAGTIASGLEVLARKGSDIILVSYKNHDPRLATVVLDELVNRYFTKHLEVHRSAAAFDFVTQQTDQVRARLNQIEDALKALKAKAGVTSIADNTATLSADLVQIEDQYLAAEAELAEQTARVKEIEESLGSSASESNPNSTKPGAATPKPRSKNKADATAKDSEKDKASDEELQRYQALVARLTQLRQAELDLLSRYTPESDLVKLNRAEIKKIEGQKREMEKKSPDLITRSSASGSLQSGPVDIAAEKARLAGVKAKTEMLKARLDERIKQLSEIGSQIADLERKKELEEANYKYFQGAVDKARVDEALDPSKMPNISAVQKPSPPMRVSGKRDKIVLALTGGGLALGIAFALLTELVLNRTVKRPLELETQLRTPLLVSIPYSASNGHSRLRGPNGGRDLAIPESSYLETAPWELDHFIRPYTEAIRDRLGLYFKLNGMTHKPKLVGVTGFAQGAGASTLAAGLAAALSETGDGKVLLVDVNVGSEDVHPFFKGRPAYPLTTALQPSGSIASAADGLYLATAMPPSAAPMQLALKRFFDLMPNFKASDFDYIIFDLPPLSQTSPTLGMAGFLDKLLLVVEAEKTHRDLVKRGFSELVAGRANVSVVFNKARSYAPKWLEGGI